MAVTNFQKNVASTTEPGLMSAEDKARLDVLVAVSDENAVIGVTMNGAEKPKVAGVVDLGSVVSGITMNGGAKTLANGVADLGNLVPQDVMVAEYSDQSLYSVGQFAFYNNKLWRCKRAIESGEAWTIRHWDEVHLDDYLRSVENLRQSLADEVSSNPIPEYEIGDYVESDGALMKVSQKTAGDPPVYSYEQTSVANELKAHEQEFGDIREEMYDLCRNLAPEYDETAAYAVGDYCVRTVELSGETPLKKLYRCKTDIASGGESWNSAHWIEKTVEEALEDREPIVLHLGPYTYDSSNGGSYEGVLRTQVFPDAERFLYDRLDLPYRNYVVIHARITDTHSTGLNGGQFIIAYRISATTYARWDFCVIYGYHSLIHGWWSCGYPKINSFVIQTSHTFSRELFETASSRTLAPEYDPTATYDVGDYCVFFNSLYGCTLYRCNATIDTPEEFTSAHWTAVNVVDTIGNKEPIVLDLGPYMYDTSTGGSYVNTLCYSVFPAAEAMVSARSDLPQGAFIVIRAQIRSTGTTGLGTGRCIMACRSENATTVRWDFCVLYGSSMINGWWSDQTYGTSSPVIWTSQPLSESTFLTAVKRNLADQYDATAAYAVGDYCVRSDSYYGFQMYRCNTAIASGGEAWTAAHWTRVTVPELADDKASKDLIAPEYDAAATYAIGDYCLHTDASGVTSLYRCKTRISTAEAFTAYHWTRLKVVDAIDTKDPIVLNLSGTYTYGSENGPTYESLLSGIFQDAETILYDQGYTAPKFVVINANVVDSDLSIVSDGRFITACRTNAVTYVKWNFTVMFGETVIHGTWTNDTPYLDSPWIQIRHTQSEEKVKKMMKTIAPEYDAAATYAVGDYCLVFGGADECALYRCSTAIGTAEPFTAAHWTKVTLTDVIKQLS